MTKGYSIPGFRRVFSCPVYSLPLSDSVIQEDQRASARRVSSGTQGRPTNVHCVINFLIFWPVIANYV